MNAERTNGERPKAPLWALLVGGWVGAWIGFGPPPANGPGWWLALLALLILVRLPLIWVGLVAAVSFGVAFVAAPLVFKVGEVLLDGPLAGPVGALANAPFGALLGLEHYLATGGLVVGLAFGTLAAFVGLGRWTHTRKRVPIRPTGLLLVLLLTVGLWFTRSSWATSILTEETESALAELNGATADVVGVDLDLVEASLSVESVSLADPNRLTTNIFQGLELTADLSSRDLLRKRVHIERVVVRRAESGSPRAVPGVLIGEPEEQQPEPPEGSFEDYLQDFEVWKERIATLREWVESMQEAEEPPAELPLADRVAPHIIEPAPSLLISEILVEGLSLESLTGETFSISAHNVSTAPGLVPGAMEFRLNTNSDLFAFGFTMPKAGDHGNLRLSLRELPVSSIANMLRLPTGDSIQGGTVDLELDGPWANGVAGFIDLPLQITLRDTRLAIAGSKPFDVSKLVLPVQLNGRIDQPRVGFDDKLLIDALKQAGQAELVKQVELRKQELLDQGKAKLEEELGEILGKDVDLGAELSVDGLKEFANEELETLKGEAKKELQDTLQKQLESMKGGEQLDGVEDVDDLKDKVNEEVDKQKDALEDQAKDKLDDLKKKALDKLPFGKPK